MQIEKFTHVQNKKTLYAVIGTSNKDEALTEVCRYKKDSFEKFMQEHKIYTGLIKGKKLYVINIDVSKDYDDLIPCFIVARDSIDLDSYINS